MSTQMKTQQKDTEVIRFVRLHTRTPYGDWLGSVVPESSAKEWVASQTEKHTNCTFSYMSIHEAPEFRFLEAGEIIEDEDEFLDKSDFRNPKWGLTKRFGKVQCYQGGRYRRRLRGKPAKNGFICQECNTWTPEALRYISKEFGNFCQGCGDSM